MSEGNLDSSNKNISYRDALPVELYTEIISVFVPSETMREALIKDGLSQTEGRFCVWCGAPDTKTVPSLTAVPGLTRGGLIEHTINKDDIVSLIKNSPTSIEKKEKYLSLIAEIEGVETNGEPQSATFALKLIRGALEGLKSKAGEIFYLKEAWYDDDVLDERMKESGAAAFTTFEAAIEYLRDEIKEEEWDDETTCWTVIEKWVPGRSGAMRNIYNYYLLGDEIVYFNDGSLYRDMERSDAFLAGNFNGFFDVGFVMPMPFQVGDIVTLSQLPFAPPVRGIIVEAGDRDVGRQVMYKNEKGIWTVRSLRSLMLAGHVMYSSYYRLEYFRGVLGEDEKLLEQVREYLAPEKPGAKERGEKVYEYVSGENRSEEEIGSYCNE